ncbi:MAG: FkbM family methyltransferase [Deltaproteobacteria bacterium]|nr:FkbM family methyltransferase [Deltaproteobacteria bacterium]
MNTHAPSTNFLLHLYSSVKRMGLLDVPLVQRIFRRTYFLYKGLLEDPFKDFTKAYPKLFQGGNIVDVGANVGYTSLLFAKVVSPGRRVFAFEPDQSNFIALQQVLRSSRCSERVVPVKAAVGEQEGTIELWINQNHHADHRVATEHFVTTEEFSSSGEAERKTVSVPQHSLDSFLAREDADHNVSFIKIDVQGYEMQVCLGMKRILENNPLLTVAFEYSPDSMRSLGFDSEELLKFFRDRKFNLYRLERGAHLSPFDDGATAARLRNRGYIDVIASRLTKF